jgi:hypothetical protein
MMMVEMMNQMRKELKIVKINCQREQNQERLGAMVPCNESFLSTFYKSSVLSCCNWVWTQHQSNWALQAFYIKQSTTSLPMSTMMQARGRYYHLKGIMIFTLPLEYKKMRQQPLTKFSPWHSARP